ncbi:MAG: flagella basal body P-ring formation protein FlgA [Planctomycetota bacterium]|nr:MAG: flagella basal body P-ring formation protein FlgA [Planctomycetota bacterium]
MYSLSLRILVPVVLLLSSTWLTALEVRLLEDEQVILGPTVPLAAIAELSGDQALVERASDVSIRRLPDLGSYTIDAAEVHAALRRHLRIHAQVQGSVVVRQAREDFDAQRLNAYAVDHLHDRAADRQIEVQVSRDATAFAIPAIDADRVEVRVEPLTDAWWGDVPYRIRFLRGEHELARTLVVLNVQAWREVPAVSRDIRRGEIISLHDVVMQRVSVAPGRGEDGMSLEDAIGQVALRAIPAGTPLGPTYARPRPDVAQGSHVLLIYDGGGFTLAIHAEALTSGRIGDTVRVRAEHGRSMEGEVIGPNEVRLREKTARR